jgi:hypothetical protein
MLSPTTRSDFFRGFARLDEVAAFWRCFAMSHFRTDEGRRPDAVRHDD